MLPNRSDKHNNQSHPVYRSISGYHDIASDNFGTPCHFTQTTCKQMEGQAKVRLFSYHAYMIHVLQNCISQQYDSSLRIVESRE